MLEALGWILTALPRSLSLALGHALGWVLEITGWKRDLISSNLLLAYPGATPESDSYRVSIQKSFYRHFGKLVVEILMMFSWSWKRWVQGHVVLHGWSNWQKAREQGKGVIFICSHLGNWEAMAAAFGASGEDLLIVTKHLKPEWLHRAMERNRARAKVRATYEPRTLKDVLAQLKKGGAVGFVLDQYAGPPIGIRVPFFGVPVGTLSAPAIIARRTGAAVVPAYSVRDSDGVFQVWIGQPFLPFESPDPSSPADPKELASRLALWVAETEKSVRKCPHQWLWSHRRFKGDLSPLAPDEWSLPRERR
ncbi:MAG: lysophospholipid acyltransferase family protein [Oligoflexia bacterium]|jgi:KDO2-lipid IV(A) lauroyltransferase